MPKNAGRKRKGVLPKAPSITQVLNKHRKEHEGTVKALKNDTVGYFAKVSGKGKRKSIFQATKDKIAKARRVAWKKLGR